MALTAEQQQKLPMMLEHLGDARAKLYPKAQGFIDDQITRYDQYKARMFLSDKQWQWLKDLHGEFCADRADELPDAPRPVSNVKPDDDFHDDPERTDLDDDAVPF